ncbi:MAG TPA: minor capsid protein [Candidatus Cottocaccamicrobium excrementipullorum]|nr:minor capsid protein [Candidatus Cottocaccamicrobium excrementipullorum]
MPVKLIRPPNTKDVTLFLRQLFLRAERQIIDEITRKRAAGYVDYAEIAALERVQEILQNMQDECWEYVPEMIEKIFYRSDKDAAGYRNARVLTATQTAAVNQIAYNLLGEIAEASETAYKTVQGFYTIARLESDPYRTAEINQVAAQEAAGYGWTKSSAKMAQELKNQGITAFVDKAGRKWTLSDYCNMCARTTARQAEVAAILTSDDHDLWQISRIGSTCPVCAPLEGRVYSKSGTNPDYPPLSLAFDKVDPNGPDSLDNTYLNIHPNCLHSLVKYTTIGKTEKQIQRDKEFSSPVANPLSRDPRTKKQIEAYRTKEQNRRKLMADIRQWRRYRAVLGDKAYRTFATFQKHKRANDYAYKKLQDAYRKQNREIKEVLDE